jgi:hypothetical protein
MASIKVQRRPAGWPSTKTSLRLHLTTPALTIMSLRSLIFWACRGLIHGETGNFPSTKAIHRLAAAITFLAVDACQCFPRTMRNRLVLPHKNRLICGWPAAFRRSSQLLPEEILEASNARIKRELGWRQAISLETRLKDFNSRSPRAAVRYRSSSRRIALLCLSRQKLDEQGSSTLTLMVK